MRKPLIDADNVVVNIIEIEPDAIYTPPDGLHLYPDEDPTAIIGGSYDPDTGTFAPPPVEEVAP